MHSDSGRVGESYTMQILFSPRPFFNLSLVVEACAIILPPICYTLKLCAEEKKEADLLV